MVALQNKQGFSNSPLTVFIDPINTDLFYFANIIQPVKYYAYCLNVTKNIWGIYWSHRVLIFELSSGEKKK